MRNLKNIIVDEVYKFDVGQIVLVNGVECIIKEREYYDGAPDYLVHALEGNPVIYGNSKPNGAGWCYEDWLKPKPTRGTK